MLGINNNNRNFNLLFLGKIISLFGDQIFSFGLAWYVLTITQSSIKMSTILILTALPTILLSPFGGLLADIKSRKAILVIMDLTRMLMLIILSELAFLDLLNLATIYSVSIILGICAAIFNPAAIAIIPNIVEPSDINKAVSANQFISSMCSILGMISGSIIYGFLGIKAILLIDAISFFLSAIFENSLDIPKIHIQKEFSSNSSKEFFSMIKEGFVYLRGKKGLYHLFIYFSATNLIFFPIGMLFLPYIFNVIIKSTSFQAGIVQATFAVGCMLGAILYSKINKKPSIYKLVVFGFLIASIVIYFNALAIIPWVTPYLSKWFYTTYYSALNILLGVAIVWINITIGVICQQEVEDTFRGRVTSFLQSLSGASIPIGYLFGGLIAQKFKMSNILFVLASMIVFITLLVFSDKNIKELQNTSEFHTYK